MLEKTKTKPANKQSALWINNASLDFRERFQSERGSKSSAYQPQHLISRSLLVFRAAGEESRKRGRNEKPSGQIHVFSLICAGFVCRFTFYLFPSFHFRKRQHTFPFVFFCTSAVFPAESHFSDAAPPSAPTPLCCTAVRLADSSRACLSK